ncbi:MAG: DinB family protein, partial [Thermomicrobiales bacterium]
MSDTSLFVPPTAVETIRLLFRFNDWTFPQMVRAVSRLSDERFHQPGVIAGGVRDGSIYAAFSHLAYVEEDWLIRWMGRSEEQSIDPAHYATLETIANHRESVKQTRDTWLANLSSDELNRVFRSLIDDEGVVRTFSLWPVLFNVPIHTSHHRAEIYEALTRFGVPPQEEPDLIDYVQAHPESISTNSHEADTAQPTCFDLIRLLYDFSDWAGQQLIRAIARVPESDLRKPGVIAGGAGDGSIQAMFAHVVGAEGYWLSRWTNSIGSDEGSSSSPVPLPSRWEGIS